MGRLNWATVIVDASFCPETKLATWATWIRMDSGVRVKHVQAFKTQIANSTDAELKAAINALWLAQERGAAAVLLQSDCAAVVDVLDYPHRKVVFQKQMRDAGITGIQELRMKHVKGHTDGHDPRHWVHNWCDAEARKTLRQLREERSYAYE